jgi:nicotinate-nucleotide adenylyltransferase
MESQQARQGRKIGLFFGTFNPVHIGHMAIANYLIEYTELNQIWFIVSPRNPHKEEKILLDAWHRYTMVALATKEDSRFRASDIEFTLPAPSYTCDTLSFLNKEYPDDYFSLIMGSDNLEYLHTWKNHEEIRSGYPIIVYPRPGFTPEKVQSMKNITLVNAPLIELSSTFIRKALGEGRDMRHFLPPESWKYLKENKFYEP